jgi:Flp pilus assembly protein TadG
VFKGSGGPYDAGVVRLVNGSSSPVTVNDVKVDLHHGPGGASGPVFDLWGSFTVPGNGEAILTQTQCDPANLNTCNFDTSDAAPFLPCGASAPPTDPRIPTVTVTTASGSDTFSDKGHVLDTGGSDKGCPGTSINESTPYSPLGTQTRAGTFTCRASALRVGNNTLLGLSPAEPVVANGPDTPCQTANTSLTPVLGGLTLGVLTASTTLNTPGALPAAGDGATANAKAANVCLGTTLPIVGTCVGLGATVLNSDASVTCTAGAGGALTPVFAGSSTLATLTLGGLPLPIANQTINLPILGTQVLNIFVNRTIQANGVLTQRALEVDLGGSPLLIVGEAQVDTTGNPCGTTVQ